ncbi:hypothetical protein CUMW_127320, partial [Citrus unshiu]
MKVASLILFILSLICAFENWDDDIPSVVYTYNRFAEIQEKCGSVLSSASELKPDDNRSSRIKEELSFVNGDWEQDSGGAPLMPFDDKEMHRSPAGPGSFLKLASFWVVDVDPVRRTRNMVSLSGIMEIGVTARQPFSYRPGWSPKFRKDPGLSSMTILFEGVYIESEENGGEWLICLLGTSMMPRTNQFLPSWELADMYGYKFGEHHQPPLIQDDQIMLVLRYNRTFSLTTGNITGEMKSLHEKSDFKYFDGVHLSSHLGLHSKYQFGAEELLSKACSPYPYQDSLVDEEVILFKDDNICDTLHRYVSRGMFDIMPSWKSVGSNDDANKLGPFILNGTAKDMDSGSNYFRLNVQNLRCSQGIDENNSNYARVFALFRVIQSWEDEYTSADRTGLSGLTLSAEGIWRSSEGQLCMVGCLGVVETSSQRCNSRICLHFPLTFSITQGTTVFGTITSISDTDSQTPLWFEKKTPPDHITSPKYLKDLGKKWSYKYSKIMQAKAFQTGSKPSVLGTLLRKFLAYPSAYDGGISSLSFLADELSLSGCVVPYAIPKAHMQSTCVTVRLHVLSLGSLFGRYWPQSCGCHQEVEQSSDFNAQTIEASGHLNIFGEHFNNISMSFEGIYDLTAGKMYLVGCRDVRLIQKKIKEEMNLERGMDCQFQVKVEYSPKDARWLKNSEVKISISSKRSKEDPLYFNPVSLKANQIHYDKQLTNMVLRKTFEDILRVLLLIIAIVCTGSQLQYINHCIDPFSYISLVMIYIPAVDYISPLISNGEIFFKWKSFHAHRNQSYEMMNYDRFRFLGYVIKVLSLYALWLTSNLGKKVSATRVRQMGHGLKQQSRLPNEKKIVLITCAVHVFGFLVTHVIREMNAVETVPAPDKFVNERSKLLEWLKELDAYLLLVPDFFLLPQIVGNVLWGNKGKPLRKFYYMGLTCLRFLLHIYDYVRDPVLLENYYGGFDRQKKSLDLNSKFGNIAVAVIAILLAMTVYKQQKKIKILPLVN